MSFQSYTTTVTLAVTETRVMVLSKQADGAKTIMVRHLGLDSETNPATLKLQESQDNSSWTDVSGSAQVVSADGCASWLVTSTKPYVALTGYGNVSIEVSVTRSDPDQSIPFTVNM